MDKKNIQSKKELILKAAEQEFMANGYEAAKTTRIAERAGVTHAMLHYYFQTKENLFKTVCENKIDILKAPMMAIAENKDLVLPERINAIIETHFDFLKANPDLPCFLIGEMHKGSIFAETLKEKIGSVIAVSCQSLQKEIDDYIDNGIIHPISAQDLIINIVSLNLSTFIAISLLQSIKKDSDTLNMILEHRKKEIIETINRRIIKEKQA